MACVANDETDVSFLGESNGLNKVIWGAGIDRIAHHRTKCAGL